MDKTFGLREKKKAILKLNMLEVLIELLKVKSFDAIKVKDICEVLTISEVTFFNYFNKKEELLLFYMKVWNYNRELRLANSRQNGLKGLYAIFEDLAKTDNAQKVMNTIINYITKLDEPPKRLFLSDCEKWLLNNEYSVKPLSLTEQIQRHLGEAFDHGEIEDSNIDALVHLISTIYYGSSVMTHLTGMNLADYYKSNLDIIFRKD